jgi:ABC-type lipoprotein export system ATPase subunit
MLKRVGLRGLRHYPKHLSGGEQQRVALARAFVMQPKLLLADEPTGNLDAATGAAIIDLIFQLNAEHGTTLVLVTHDEMLARRCTRQIRLAGGRVRAGKTLLSMRMLARDWRAGSCASSRLRGAGERHQRGFSPPRAPGAREVHR